MYSLLWYRLCVYSETRIPSVCDEVILQLIIVCCVVCTVMVSVNIDNIHKQTVFD